MEQDPPTRADEPARTPRRRRRGRTALALGLGLVVLFGALVVVTHVLGPATPAGGAAGPATVTTFACASGFTPPASGQRQITVRNVSHATVDVALVDPRTSLVYGALEGVGPGTTRQLEAVIPPGHYRLQCSYGAGEVLYSPTVTVTGAPVADAHPYRPVTITELEPCVSVYRNDVMTGLTQLATDTDTLRADADAGAPRAQTEAAWLTAHLDYERLGAAYGTFGDYDTAINGRPNGLPQGTADPGWAGFFRLEYALWQGQPAATVAAVADQLDQSVHALAAAFPDQVTPPNDLALRTHEILENTLQFELTGQTDQGSHTNLATARANVSGAEMTLSAIAPLLQSRDPKLLSAAETGLAGLGQVLDAYQQPDGTWTPLDSLTQAQRQQVDSTVGSLLETLAPIPDLLELPAEDNVT